MLGQLNINGKDKIQVAINRFKEFEPEEGYYLAFSGGKDSIVIKKLAELSKVKFDSHYNWTTVDPPELLKYIKKYHPDTTIEKPDITMWQLIPKKKMPPTRLVRYCCSELKEKGGIGRFVVTGVRWAESSRRKNSRNMVEFDRYGSQSKKAKENRELFLMNDNEGKRRMIEQCTIKGKHILNPVIDWTDKDIWDFIKMYDVPYCKLYDQGFDRLGCIGCPMQGTKGMERDFKRWSKYKTNYIKAFDRMIKARKEKGLKTEWETGEEVFNWWLYNQ